jgi:transcriptional regulator with XRE-family HTH domain
MRRLMLGMNQTELGDALGLTFQQVQKYEKGRNRISASKLLQSAHFLRVPVTFFFEGASSGPAMHQARGKSLPPSYVFDFLATREGHALIKAFMQIKDAKLRRRAVDLVKRIADQ